MATETNPQTDVLHSDNHSRLSAEEIAKALARHNKNHPAEKEKSPTAKGKKSGK